VSEDERSGGERTPAEIAAAVDRPVLLFDGVCNLCNRLVRFVVRFDAEGTFLFAQLQSPVGRALLERCGRAPESLDTVVLVDGEDCVTKSTAALEVCRRLDGPWPLVSPLLAVPERVRDRAYEFVAAHRYRVFGRSESCQRPPSALRERFLERSLGE
jgi:predicted DCC family thiol-disulfide oxidoreductase YuxK